MFIVPAHDVCRAVPYYLHTQATRLGKRVTFADNGTFTFNAADPTSRYDVVAVALHHTKLEHSTASGHFTVMMRESPTTAVHYNDSVVSRLTLPEVKDLVSAGNTALIFAVRSSKPMDFSVSVSLER